MNQEIMYGAFVDELVKIGHINEETAFEILKEAGLVSQIGGAAKNIGAKLIGRGGGGAAAAAARPRMSEQAMTALKAQWKAGAPRGAAAQLRHGAPSAGSSAAARLRGTVGQRIGGVGVN